MMDRKGRGAEGGTGVVLIVAEPPCPPSLYCGDRAMKETVSFESLPRMVATSDLVIEGTVRIVEPGRIVGAGDASIQFAQVTVSVDRVLFGRWDAVNVVVEEYGLERGHPSRTGDHGIYFLHQKADAPMFQRLVNSQGRFLDDGKGGLVAPNDEADWVKAIESEPLSQLQSDVRAAARAVAEGRVEPAKPII
ncbi:MAG TPA: hypothetical protein VF195_06170 [Actinomycetota bacterium]